jgi:hypothetical protein
MTREHAQLMARVGTAIYSEGDLPQSDRDAVYNEVEALITEVVRLREEANVAAALHRELNDLFGWGDESMLHASLHVRNAVTNLRCDLRAEKFLRENADRITASQVEEERAAVVAALRASANAPHPIERGVPSLSPVGRGLLLFHADRIERGEHLKENP